MMFVFQRASNEGLKLTLGLGFFGLFFYTIEAKYQRATAESSSIPAFMNNELLSKYKAASRRLRGERNKIAARDAHPHARHELNIISGAEMSITLFELIALTRSQHIRSRHLSSSASTPTRTAVSG